MTFVPLFAFGFLSPWLLLGGLAAASPIIIHLLNRRKYREMEWAAMRFLLEAVRKNARRIQVEQLLLLALRVLILLLFALALSRPYVETFGEIFQAKAEVHKILVMDASYSMGFQPQEAGTLFEQAREIARNIVKNSRQGDAFNLVQNSELNRAEIVNPAFKPADVLSEIEGLRLPDARGNLRGCLERVRKIVQSVKSPMPKEIYLLSDFQQATWSGETAEEAEAIRVLLRELDAAGALILVDVGQSNASNRAVTEVSLLSPLVVVGEPARIRATVTNFSTEPGEATLELLVDEHVLEKRRVTLRPRDSAVESFSHQFVEGGEHRVELRISGDELKVDDHRHLTVSVRDRIRVLCINGRSSGSKLGKATDFLTLALAPETPSRNMDQPRPSAANSLFAPEVISAGELQGQDLTKFDCVVLCNVALVTPQDARMFETYLRSGGGMVWCMGDRVQPEVYNQILYRDGQGPLPAKLGDRAGDPANREKAFNFDAGDFQHPIVAPFEGNPDAGLQSAPTYAYLKSVLNSEKGAKLALRYDTGDVAIAEMPYGSGRSVLVTTSVDESWTSWPVWPSFLPMARELVLHAVSGGPGQRQQLVGSPLMQTYHTLAPAGDAAVSRPQTAVVDGKAQESEPVSVALTEVDGARQFNYADTDLSGIYAVALPPPIARTELFAVNVDPRESNLTKLESDELKVDLFSGLEFDYQTQWQERTGTPGQPVPTVQRGILPQYCLYAALFLLLVEPLMAWNFRSGLWMLGAGISAVYVTAIAWWSLRTHPAWLALALLPLLWVWGMLSSRVRR